MSNYFEDVPLGATVELGQTTFDREMILAFAEKWDPQPFHLDEEAAKKSLFGGLCASGWHTAAMWLRHNIDHRNRINDQIRYRGGTLAKWGPSPGFEKIRWLKPVFVGDTIRYSQRVKEKIESKSRPTLGLVVADNEGHNQNGEMVFSVISKIFVERRVPGPSAKA